MQSQILQDLLSNQYVLIGLAVWELAWKGLALWKAAKVGQKVFFVAILVINTIGILPIAYLIYRKVLETKSLKKIS
jgi:hypothetical protein